MATKRKITQRHYGFDKLKPGNKKQVAIPANDGRAGIRALTAAYQYARRRNVGVRAKSKRMVFAGRTSASGKMMTIHRVQ